MEQAMLSSVVPVRGVEYDHSDPESRERWLAQRRTGITATEIRDWHRGGRRREIITEKVTGESPEFYSEEADHGVAREPIIADWAHANFGIEPCNAVYLHGSNPRHLASPDGITLDPFSRELVVGTPDAALMEIKTSGHDLTPGLLDAARVLVRVALDSAFDRMNYYAQVQWQMYVMNATVTLFVWEKRSKDRDPETGGFLPDGPPQFCWIPRDQSMIDSLVAMADEALAEIDAARLSNTGPLPDTDLDPEIATLVADYFAALDAEKVAAAAKKQAWDALNGMFVGEGKPDVQIVDQFAKITVNTTRRRKQVVDEPGMAAKAPALVAKYLALRDRFTTVEQVPSQALTITRQDAGPSTKI